MMGNSTTVNSSMASAWPIDVRIDIDRVIDPQKTQRLRQFLFSESTGVTVASSTGVA